MNTEVTVNSSFLDRIEFPSSQCILKINGTINSRMASELSDNLLKLDKKNMKFIPIEIHSEGGDVDALLMIIQAMEHCVTPIATFCFGHAASAAAVIFCMGSNGYRYMGPHSYIMFHEYSMGYGEAKGCDLAAIQTHMTKIDKMINKKLEKHMGISNNFFEKFGHVDTYLNARDALKIGIVNHVGYPTIKLDISLDMSIKLKKGIRQEIDDPDERPYKYKKYITEPILHRTSLLEGLEDEE